MNKWHSFKIALFWFLIFLLAGNYALSKDKLTIGWKDTFASTKNEETQSSSLEGVIVDPGLIFKDGGGAGNGGSDKEEARNRILTWFNDDLLNAELKRYVIDYVNTFIAIAPIQALPSQWQSVHEKVRAVGPDGNYLIVQDIVRSNYIPSLETDEFGNDGKSSEPADIPFPVSTIVEVYLEMGEVEAKNYIRAFALEKHLQNFIRRRVD